MAPTEGGPTDGALAGVAVRALASVLTAGGGAADDGRPADRPADRPAVNLPSGPGTVVWGELPGPRAPVLRVPSGAAIDVDTVSHHLMCEDVPPLAAFGALGVGPDEVLPDVVRIHAEVPRAPGGSPHVLTGPIAVDGARPGDVLEIRIEAAAVRVPYGVNRGRPGAGVLPDLVEDVTVRLLRVDDGAAWLRWGDVARIRLAPFPGIVAVTPAPGAPGADLPDGRRSARGLGAWGGNLDLRHLVPGTSLFLPVAVDDALLYVGDPHGAQGDGEVNGNAVEQSCRFRIRPVLHRGIALSTPVVATPTAWLVTGIDPDLDVAVRLATAGAVDLLLGLTSGAIDAAEAYGLCGAGVDVGVAQVVNGPCLAHAAVPRTLLVG